MRSKRRWFPVLAAFSLVLTAQVQAAATSTNHHTLWKVQGPQCSVYLLGSVHVLNKSDYPLAAPIETAFSNASVAAFETDISALEDPAVAMKMLAKSRLPEGESLKTQLSPATYKLWTRHATEAGVPPELFEQLTPVMAAVTVTMLEMQKMGLDPSQGIDKHFYPLARERGMEIVPLETVDTQIGLVTDFSKEEGELLMKSTLEEMDTLKSEFAGLIKAWRTGDADALDKLLTTAMKDSPAIYKRMLTDRNRNWLPKIEELTRGKKNAIVIVGAAHLVGKEGIVELLKKKGLNVTQE